MTALTIDHLVRRATASTPDAVFLVDGDRRVTFAELADAVDEVAAALSGVVSPGERVVLWLPNSIEFAVWFFAVVRVGAVAVTMNTELQVPEAGYIVGDSTATMIVTVGEHRGRPLAELAVEVAGASGHDVSVVVVEGAVPTGASAAADLLAAAPHEPTLPDPDPDRPAFMLYTSGTTGRPKGALHTHRFLEVLEAAGRRLRIGADDAVVLYLPMYHIYGLVAGLVLFLSASARVVLMRSFRAVASLELMERERATILYGVPTTYIDQLDSPELDRFDLSSIRLCFAPFALDLSERVARRWGTTVNVYGMTETAAITLLPDLDDDELARRATVGRPVDGVEARIVDEVSGADMERGELGELLVRGPSITIGYHGKPAETARAIDADGWFHTGDLAAMDDAGRVSFTGRRGDLYRVGGELVDPVEVEAVLQSHPDIARAAVVGVDDDRLGKVGEAWVLPRDGRAVDAEDLIEFARATLARFKVPRQVHVVDRFPTTPSGKVQKYVLLQQRQGVG